MRLLTRYLTKEIIGPFIFGISGFTAIQAGLLLINLTQKPMLDGLTVMKLTALQLPRHLSLSFPMAIVLSTLLGLGRLSSHSEIVAMRAGGLSGLRLVLPFAVFGLFASICSLYLGEVLTPQAMAAYRRLQAKALGEERTGIITNEVLPPEFDREGRLQRLIYVGRFDLENLRLNDVYIHEYLKGREKTSLWAEEMIWDGAAWRFQGGEVKFFQEDGGFSRLTVKGGRAEYQPLLPKPREISKAAADPEDMNWRDFRAFIKRREEQGADVRRFLIELYTRLAIPFACFSLALVGAPLGVQTKRAGSAMSFGFAIVLVFAYYFLLSLMQILGRAGVLTPQLAAWSANIVLCLIGAYLIKKRMY